MPDDYVSTSVGYNYTEKEVDNGLIKFLEDIQPNEQDRDYMMTYLSCALYENEHELFTVLTEVVEMERANW